MRSRLRDVVRHSRLTTNYVKMDIPYFFWYSRTSKDCTKYELGFRAGPLPDDAELHNYVYSQMGPTFFVLAWHYFDKGDTEMLQALGKVWKKIPLTAVPMLVNQKLEEFFG